MSVFYDIDQYDDIWWALRFGKVSASNAARVISGRKDTRDNYRLELLAERFCGPVDGYKSKAMEEGSESEAIAAQKFTEITGLSLSNGGFYLDDKGRYGASPDRHIVGGGILEIKCPETKQHLSLLEADRPHDNYMPQINMQLLLSEEPQAHFVSWHPTLPMVHFIVRRDVDALISMQQKLDVFCDELDDAEDRIRSQILLKRLSTTPQDDIDF